MGEGVAARILFLSLGGILGVNARYWLGEWITLRLGPRFPWGTFFANASGAFLIGALAVLLARWLPHTHARLFVITGFLGGYTTFSSYTFEALNLWERGEPGRAMVYLFGSLVAGAVAVVLGVVIARGSIAAMERPDQTLVPEIAGPSQETLSGASQTP
jgi:CrcB protein